MALHPGPYSEGLDIAMNIGGDDPGENENNITAWWKPDIKNEKNYISVRQMGRGGKAPELKFLFASTLYSC